MESRFPQPHGRTPSPLPFKSIASQKKRKTRRNWRNSHRKRKKTTSAVIFEAASPLGLQTATKTESARWNECLWMSEWLTGWFGLWPPIRRQLRRCKEIHVYYTPRYAGRTNVEGKPVDAAIIQNDKDLTAGASNHEPLQSPSVLLRSKSYARRFVAKLCTVQWLHSI